MCSKREGKSQSGGRKRFTLYKMTMQGKIAVFNLVAVGIVLLALMILSPPGESNGAEIVPWKETIGSILGFVLVILVFPLGWLIAPFLLAEGPCVGPIILFPLNAYLWGHLLKRIVLKSRRNREERDSD